MSLFKSFKGHHSRIFPMKKPRTKHQMNCFECAMRPIHGTMNSTQKIDGSAHFVHGRQRDDHRPNRKRLRAILLFSGQKLGNSVCIYLERQFFPATLYSNEHTHGFDQLPALSRTIKVLQRKVLPCRKNFVMDGNNFVMSRKHCCHGRK